MSDSATADYATPEQESNDPAGRRSLTDSLTSKTCVRTVCALGLLFVLGDIVTTVYGLNVGLRERNPFVVSVLTDHGVVGLVGLKLLILGWVAVIWRALGRRYGIAAMAGLMVPQAIAVVLNVITILSL